MASETYDEILGSAEMIEHLRRTFDAAYEKWLKTLGDAEGCLPLADFSSENLFHIFLQELRPGTPPRPVWQSFATPPD